MTWWQFLFLGLGFWMLSGVAYYYFVQYIMWPILYWLYRITDPNRKNSA